MYDKLLNYNLIGIGEFSHGIQESWEFRFNLLKYAIKNSNKKIVIFNEIDIWMGDSLIFLTIYFDIKIFFLFSLIRKEMD